MNIEKPILITGCARSRTSLVAGIIDRCGGFGGSTTPPLPHNKKGQFENDRMRNYVKKYLQIQGYDKLGQNPLPDIDNLRKWDLLGQTFENIMVDEGYNGRDQVYYKGAKMCLIWPIFNQHFPNAKWVFVRRNTEDIISSCIRTRFMRKREGREGWKEWIDHHLHMLDMMHESGLDVTEIWTDDLIKGNFTDMKSFVSRFPKLKWDQMRVENFVDPTITRKSDG